MTSYNKNSTKNLCMYMYVYIYIYRNDGTKNRPFACLHKNCAQSHFVHNIKKSDIQNFCQHDGIEPRPRVTIANCDGTQSATAPLDCQGLTPCYVILIKFQKYKIKKLLEV